MANRGNDELYEFDAPSQEMNFEEMVDNVNDAWFGESSFSLHIKRHFSISYSFPNCLMFLTFS